MDFYDITIHSFLETLVEWILEYYVFALPLFWGAKKRDRFPLRLILGLLVLVLVAYPLAIFYHAYGNGVLARSLVYLVLFALALLHMRLCFKTDLFRLVLIGDFAYLIQNMAYKFFVSVYSTFIFFSRGSLSIAEPVYKAIYYGFFFLQAALCYRFLIPQARKQMMEHPTPRRVIVVSAFTVLISTFLSSVQDIHIQKIGAGLYDSPDVSFYLVRLSGYALALLLNASIIILIFLTSRSDSLRKDIVDLRHVIDQSAKQYEISQQTIDAINIKCHDMKHRVNKIVGNALPEDALKDIDDTIAIYDALIDTGNKTLDVVLTEKSLACEANHIALTKTVDGTAIDFMEVGDVFCLFGNLLDNAIEAVKGIEDPSKRYINLSLAKAGQGIVRVECANYFQGPISFKDGLPLTTKGDTFYHGFGTRSIREIAKRYNGSVSFETTEGIFNVHIVFFNLK